MRNRQLRFCSGHVWRMPPLRGALKVGMGKGALVGIVSAEAIALMEGIIKSMTNAKLMLVAAAALDCRTGDRRRGRDGVFRDRARRIPRAQAIQARKLASRLRPLRSRRARPAPLPRNRPRTKVPSCIQVEVVDPEGHRLCRGRCRRDSLVFARLRETSSRSSSEPEPMAPAKSSSRSLANARVRQSRLRTSGRTKPGVRLRRPSVSLTGKTPPPVIHLTLDQPAKWTITVLGPDDRPIAGLRLAPHSLSADGPPQFLADRS